MSAVGVPSGSAGSGPPPLRYQLGVIHIQRFGPKYMQCIYYYNLVILLHAVGLVVH